MNGRQNFAFAAAAIMTIAGITLMCMILLIIGLAEKGVCVG